MRLTKESEANMRGKGVYLDVKIQEHDWNHFNDKTNAYFFLHWSRSNLFLLSYYFLYQGKNQLMNISELYCIPLRWAKMPALILRCPRIFVTFHLELWMAIESLLTDNANVIPYCATGHIWAVGKGHCRCEGGHFPGFHQEGLISEQHYPWQWNSLVGGLNLLQLEY